LSRFWARIPRFNLLDHGYAFRYFKPGSSCHREIVVLTENGGSQIVVVVVVLTKKGSHNGINRPIRIRQGALAIIDPPQWLALAFVIPCSSGHTTVFVVAAVANDWHKYSNANKVWIGWEAPASLRRIHWNHLGCDRDTLIFTIARSCGDAKVRVVAGIVTNDRADIVFTKQFCRGTRDGFFCIILVNRWLAVIFGKAGCSCKANIEVDAAIAVDGTNVTRAGWFHGF
jgi:hypothetical protein